MLGGSGLNKEALRKIACDYVNNNPGNFVSEEKALEERLIGMRMYEEPVIMCGRADDGLFSEFKKPSIIGGHFMAPAEWLSGAKTVISIFMPFMDNVKKSNALIKDMPSTEWLHARIEGQEFIGALLNHLKEHIEAHGHKCVIPSADQRFKGRNPEIADDRIQGFYTSSWSERHAGFVCGQGTFGLSKGLISKKGVAGRYASLIVDFELDYDERDYTDPYEYCTMCGACVIKCPVNAISKEEGKKHPICSDYLDITREKYAPRYGCGKCQVAVPCESKAPVKI